MVSVFLYFTLLSLSKHEVNILKEADIIVDRPRCRNKVLLKDSTKLGNKQFLEESLQILLAAITALREKPLCLTKLLLLKRQNQST